MPTHGIDPYIITEKPYICQGVFLIFLAFEQLFYVLIVNFLRSKIKLHGFETFSQKPVDNLKKSVKIVCNRSKTDQHRKEYTMKKALSLILTAIILLTATLPLAACGKKEECELCGDEYPEKKMDKVRFAGDIYYVCEDCEDEEEDCERCGDDYYEFELERVKFGNKTYQLCGDCAGEKVKCYFCKEKGYELFMEKRRLSDRIIYLCVDCRHIEFATSAPQAPDPVTISVALIIKDGVVTVDKEDVSYTGTNPTLGEIICNYCAANDYAEPFDEQGLLRSIDKLSKGNGKTWSAFYEHNGKDYSFTSIKEQPVSDGDRIVVLLD